MLLIFGIILCSGFALSEIPSDITRCHIYDGNCLTKSIEYVMRKYPNGNRDLNLDSIDPLRIKEISIIQSPQSPVRINLFFKNILVTGLKNINYHNVTTKQDTNGNYRLDASYQIPLFVLDSDYTVDGSILVLPITGQGRCKMSLRNVVARHKYRAVPFVKDGRQYIKIERFKLSFTTDKMVVNFENLFNNNKILGDAMNQFINENWNEILEELKPAFIKSLSGEFQEIHNKVFTNIPLNDLYLLDN